MRSSALGALLAMAGLTGCFEPQIRDGQLACELDVGCPSGFVCLDGFCRNSAPDGKSDEPDGDVDEEPIPPDAGPTELGPGPKIYSLESGLWTARLATDVFAGSAINPAAVQTAFSLCDSAAEIRCYADAATITCAGPAGRADGTWSSLNGDLADLSPTFGAVFAVSADVYDYYFHRGPEWQGYTGPPLELAAGFIASDLEVFASTNDGAQDLDEIYEGDDNAPASFDQIVYDYVDSTAAGDPWHFVEADGRRFTVHLDGSTTTDTDPHLALPGAPAAADVRAALMCNGVLELYAVD